MIDGSHSTVCGTYVMITSVMSSGTSHGITALTVASNEIFATFCNMNSTIPTGGVSSPIIRFSTMIRPKCTGSMPSFAMIGMNTGTRIVIAAIVSMKQPIKSKNTLASSRNTAGLAEIDSTQAPIASVTRVVVSTHAKIDAEATMNSTTAVVSIVSIETLTNIRHVKVLYQPNPRNSAHATAATAASVGVNNPDAMPPMRITGVNSAMNASNLNTLSAISTPTNGTPKRSQPGRASFDQRK